MILRSESCLLGSYELMIIVLYQYQLQLFNRFVFTFTVCTMCCLESDGEQLNHVITMYKILTEHGIRLSSRHRHHGLGSQGLHFYQTISPTFLTRRTI